MKKDKHITIRISTEIKKLIDQKANRLKISRSELVRRLLIGNLKNETMKIEYMCDGCGDIISEDEHTVFEGWCENCYENSGEL